MLGVWLKGSPGETMHMYLSGCCTSMFIHLAGASALVPGLMLATGVVVIFHVMTLSHCGLSLLALTKACGPQSGISRTHAVFGHKFYIGKGYEMTACCKSMSSMHVFTRLHSGNHQLGF